VNTIKNNALSIVFFLASVVLGISDQIYLLPIPPKLAQYWWFVLCLAFLVNSFRVNNGKIPQKDLLEMLDIAIKKKNELKGLAK